MIFVFDVRRLCACTVVRCTKGVGVREFLALAALHTRRYLFDIVCAQYLYVCMCIHARVLAAEVKWRKQFMI